MTFCIDKMTLDIDEKYVKDSARKRMTSKEQNQQPLFSLALCFEILFFQISVWFAPNSTQVSAPICALREASPARQMHFPGHPLVSLSFVQSTCDLTVDHKCLC